MAVCRPLKRGYRRIVERHPNILRHMRNPQRRWIEQMGTLGAGRQMSRTQAKKRFTLADLKLQTEGVECRRDKGVLDEAPGAYKNIDEVMAQQSDLVEVIHALKQVICVKG